MRQLILGIAVVSGVALICGYHLSFESPTTLYVIMLIVLVALAAAVVCYPWG